MKNSTASFDDVPAALLWDKGTANSSHLIQHLLARLSAPTPPPCTPRASGDTALARIRAQIDEMAQRYKVGA